jgi:predicted glutamine amidotransferase
MKIKKVIKFCGINAVISKEDKNILLSAKIAQSLDDRGKDATGVAWIKNGKISVLKSAIEPEKFVKKFSSKLKSNKSNMIIGHNRSATSSVMMKQKDTEAHPFLSEKEDFVLVQNGVVSYSDPKREILRDIGHKFSSSVDSEILVHLLEEILDKSNSRDEAIKQFVKVSSGNILILFKDKELYGIADNDNFTIVKSNSDIFIASELRGIISEIDLNSYEDMKVFLPEDSNKKYIKIYFDEDIIKCELHGKWSKFDLKDHDWIFNKVVVCDFCEKKGPCEKVVIDNNSYDRCLDCYKSNKVKPVYPGRSTRYLPFQQSKDNIISREGEVGICSYCFLPIENKNSDLIFCLNCLKFFCKEHFAIHKCTKEQDEDFDILDILAAYQDKEED